MNLKMVGDIFTGFMVVAGVAIVITGLVIGSIPTSIVGALIGGISGYGLYLALK